MFNIPFSNSVLINQEVIDLILCTYALLPVRPCRREVGGQCLCVRLGVHNVSPCSPRLPVTVSRTPPNGKDTLQRFNKSRKVLGLLLISLCFLNTFDPSDSEIYCTNQGDEQSKPDRNQAWKHFKWQLRAWWSVNPTKLATEPFLFIDFFPPFWFYLLITAWYRINVELHLCCCAEERPGVLGMHTFSSSALTEKKDHPHVCSLFRGIPL